MKKKGNKYYYFIKANERLVSLIDKKTHRVSELSEEDRLELENAPRFTFKILKGGERVWTF